MPINHRFLEHDFGNGFQTHNAILDTIPYEPEVLILGTFNPWTEYPCADFFYGRFTSWFWIVMKNLIVNGPQRQQMTQRIRLNNEQLIEPEISEIIHLSERVKVTFADLVKQTMFVGNPQYVLLDNTNQCRVNISCQGVDYNLVNDNDLALLDAIGQVNWGTHDIINYIQRTPSIKCVLFTRNPNQVWQQHWDLIRQANYGDRVINFGRIHTPAGVGLMEPRVNPAVALARRWLWHIDPERRFCKSWINQYVVNPDGFNYPDHSNRLNG